MKNVIFDIDGTIADCNHRRHHVDGSGPVDWNAFRAETVNDTPNQHVCDIKVGIISCLFCGKLST